MPLGEEMKRSGDDNHTWRGPRRDNLGGAKWRALLVGRSF